MAARIAKEQSTRWQVIVPWQRNGELSEVVAVEIVTAKSEVAITMLGGRQIVFPLERAKLFSEALREAVASLEPAE